MRRFQFSGDEVVKAKDGAEGYAFDGTPLHADQDLHLFSSGMEPRLIGVEIDKLQYWSSQC
ncbi:hypothetical protein BDN72DRAFT_904809 [Pluteus cervinus]|uniref:Uncharacterized protein n=1 Tax=Pluteus cervinus TaxID=181527 RepID=A0ACD3A713_9AGAR|nr:hypothetical protein BDN72DRAFT_904809 [Pluteus cervinus]